ncbi:calcium-transporting ATPase 10, plasma membrane-type-like isoform X1 [Quercus lobata]|uniref:calcium-transporting ATPase 10, plasma membrane-type-like isoform X1 n=1 Tax=Quercus lobata TaxID=97700 RepID=UPI001248ED99|nr:calcium-transporting ATPase 10, plasma membrane-type-like isoform X1 [Quercus lobata]XP_030953219.1 calcium-transporting ATPase 10, plasma membrane-type-like isoform X1 [Quercus lobata]XP_030953221.1 calcium-transporting ATPase 10, plasma membrane-type-like isoform X1 [Quercus lobata]XP_030953222.1 calcium-transporting ATPase 10, plasma membrane-type-like isoform X1 [Quercus lobata]XP_030953223.1 calcium-transporting ATPase 10, plasma membrane-type-like isoform X1 [Quercus lobata]XP_0309532
MSFFKGSPYRRHNNNNNDVEAGGGSRGDEDEESSSSDPFNITSTKNASIERLRKWRQAALVLNASRRFRYTLDLKREEEKQQLMRKVRVNIEAIRAANRFKAAGEQRNGSGTSEASLPPPSPSGGHFAIGQDQLAVMSRDHDVSALQQCGGVKGLSELLKTNLEKGIKGDDADLLKRKNAFGSNTYPKKKGRSFWMFLWEAWQDLTLIILIVAAVASLALGIKSEGIKEGWYDGGSIAFAVILVIVVTAISDYKQSLQFQSLNEEKRNIHMEVIRGGRRVEISIYDIVVGDVLPLNIGDQVPADGVLISGHSLAIDESSMTGESKIVHKDSRDPFLMSGCKVADGSGTMLVTSVGINTEWGMLMASISEDTGEETPLQVRLNGVATLIGMVGLTVAVCVLIVLLVRYFTGHTKDANGNILFTAGKTKLSPAIDGAIKIVTVAVTIVVVAVPEGLPLAVTLTLAYSMRKMMADKALVRRLSACETMGSATTICSDKTGTLTLNQMTVVEAYVGGKKIDSPENKSEWPSMLYSLLIEGIAQNTNGSVYVSEGGDVELSGSPTEKAILNLGLKLGMNFEAIRSESSVIHVFPFNSDKKRGGIALKLPDSQIHIHWKGAAEIVLASCTQYFDAAGQLVAMDEDKAMDFKKAIGDMASGSLRCVAMAYRLYEVEKVPSAEEQLDQWALPEDDLVLLAIVGIKDPCRPGVKDSVQLCQNAGIKVRMVTGDNIQTAKAIASECGILGSDDDVTEPTLIEGRVFRELSESRREEIVDQISVMGRSSPNDKLLLVQALRKRGHVVAVTGDGTNDAPALHEADIGLAMGISGTEVAKESSDIVILDDNFASVVKVVRWGRSVYANIQKFIQFQLTVNVAALIINVVAAVSSGDVPLNAVQLLWVNLIMDTLGALALATEPPTDHLMDRPPVGRREPLITNIMWRNLLIQALYQVTVLLVLNFQGRSILKLEGDTVAHATKVKNTLIFNAFVLCQIFNEFNARKPDEFNVFKGITKNYLFMGIVGATVVLQVLIIEFLGKFTSTVKLNWSQWLISVIIGIISWPLAVLGKLIPVSETPIGNGLKKLKCCRRGASQS